MTLKEQEKNDSDLADWLLDRLLNPQDVFDQNVVVRWTESGRERAKRLIQSTITSARKNTATE